MRTETFAVGLKRSYILTEIVSTEKSYRDDLHAIIDHILVPLRQRSDLIKRAQLESIFAGGEVIASVSNRLCAQLEDGTKSGRITSNANIEGTLPASGHDGATSKDNVDDEALDRALEAFCTMSDFLKAIGAFSAVYDRAVATLAQAERRPQICSLFQRISARRT